MAKALTEIAIKNLEPGPARREVPDGKVSGLYLQLQPSGARSWAWRYRFAGRPRKLTIGAYPAIALGAARALAQEAAVKVARGVDPGTEKSELRAAAHEERAREVDLVERVVEQFIDRHAKAKTRDWRETKRLLDKDIVPRWKKRRLADITRADVRDLLDSIVDRGAPVGANRTFAQLRKLCGWAVERGIIDRSPCEGVKPPSSEQSRDRVLSADELRLVWEAAGKIGFPFGPVTRLLILTGQRRSEVAGMTWAELELETAMWRIPAERSKNRRAHEVPLSAAAMAILKSLPRFTREKGATDFVFSSGDTAPSGFSRAKTRLDAAILAELREADPEAEALADWTLHDIRRSAASGMAAIGIDLHIVERCLNHVSGSFAGIVQVYQRHSFADEMRKALDAWARRVEAIVSGAPAGNVVELAKARG